jgi:hypothetical protein
MTKRKPKSKPALSPLIEWPKEELRVVTVTVEHKAARADEARQGESELPVTRSLPTIH